MFVKERTIEIYRSSWPSRLLSISELLLVADLGVSWLFRIYRAEALAKIMIDSRHLQIETGVFESGDQTKRRELANAEK